MTTEPCPDCVKATLGPWHGFTGGCKGCAARALSRSPDFARVRKAGMLDRAYRAALELYGVTHEQAREAAKTDALFVPQAVTIPAGALRAGQRAEVDLIDGAWKAA